MLLVILFVLLLFAILIGALIKKFVKWVTSPVVYKTHIEESPNIQEISINKNPCKKSISV